MAANKSEELIIELANQTRLAEALNVQTKFEMKSATEFASNMWVQMRMVALGKKNDKCKSPK